MVRKRVNDPVANGEAIVTVGNARFTVLTPELMRLEWAKDGEFIDSATLLFINRKLPVPKYETKIDRDWLIIQTEKLKLRYQTNSGKFNKQNLSIEFNINQKIVCWLPELLGDGN